MTPAFAGEHNSMRLPNRVLLSLAVSIGLAILLLILEQHFQSELLFYAQFPGFITLASIFGVHGGYNEILEKSVLVGANALVYWPLLLALSFLIKTKRAG
jgi:hypothetical protein